MGSTDFVRAMFMMPEQSSPEVNRAEIRKESAHKDKLQNSGSSGDGLVFKKPLMLPDSIRL